MRRPDLEFDFEDAQLAGEEWGFNCGPAALCAILGWTPQEIRTELAAVDFESKRYMSPTMMSTVLRGISVDWSDCLKTKEEQQGDRWPTFGLARIQWHGPWMKDGVPIRARYKYTHWVASELVGSFRSVFDVNAMWSGGWISYVEWSTKLVPWLVPQLHKRWNETWSVTHAWRVNR